MGNILPEDWVKVSKNHYYPDIEYVKKTTKKEGFNIINLVIVSCRFFSTARKSVLPLHHPIFEHKLPTIMLKHDYSNLMYDLRKIGICELFLIKIVTKELYMSF